MHEVLEKLRRELTGAMDGLSVKETQLRRAPEKWTIQQIVDHLLLSYKATYEAASVRLAKGTPTKASPSFGQRFGQFRIATCGLFPEGYLAPAAVSPQHPSVQELSGEQLAKRIDESLDRMDHALTEAEGIFGPSRRAISHLVLGPMSVSQWHRFHLVHARHHLKQIAATRSLIRNPRG